MFHPHCYTNSKHFTFISMEQTGIMTSSVKCSLKQTTGSSIFSFFFFWFINLFVVTLTMNGKFCWIVWIPAKVTRYRFPNKNGKLLFISPHVLLQTNKMALLTALSRFIGQKYKYLQFAGWPTRLWWHSYALYTVHRHIIAQWNLRATYFWHYLSVVKPNNSEQSEIHEWQYHKKVHRYLYIYVM